jgi:hypothetical protein
MIASIDDYNLVLLSTTEQLFAASLAYALKQDIIFLANAILIAFGRQFVLKGNELVQSTYLYLLANIIGQMLAGIGAGTLAILEHE